MQFHFGKSFDLLKRTLPFVLLRLVVYGLAVILSVLWFFGILVLFANWTDLRIPGPPWLAWVFGGLTYSVLAKLVRNYILYLLKAAHIAVITRLLVSGSLPEGTNQLSYGKDLVFRHFLRISILFGVDRLVNVVLKAFNRSVFKLLSFVPAKGSLSSVVQRVLDYSAGFVDEAILSYSLLYPQANPWSTARDGLVLYVQNWRVILGSGLVLALMSYVLVGVVAAPLALAALAFGGPMMQAGIGAALALGFFAKFALMDPFALTAVIVNFHEAIAGQEVSREMERKLGDVSDRFREFSDKASSWGPGTATPPPPPVSL